MVNRINFMSMLLAPSLAMMAAASGTSAAIAQETERVAGGIEASAGAFPFQVALLDLGNKQVQVLTDSDRDESPSFAPNGRMILLATVIAGRGVLSAVSSDGRVKQRLTVTAGDVREPAWGPFNE